MLPFAIPFIIGSSCYGIKKGYDAVKNFKKAYNVNGSTKRLLEQANHNLDNAQSRIKRRLEKLIQLQDYLYHDKIRPFYQTLSKIKTIQHGEDGNTTNNTFKLNHDMNFQHEDIEWPIETLKQEARFVLGLRNIAGCVLFNAASTFGTASTGTAIRGLTGVASKKATLAFLGGGSLATGGSGIFGGMVILGGLMAASILAVGGHIIKQKTQETKQEAFVNWFKAYGFYSQTNKVVSEINVSCSHLKEVYTVLSKFDELLTPQLEWFEELINKGENNWDSMDHISQKRIFILSNLVKKMRYALRELPSLDSYGFLTDNSNKIINELYSFINEVEKNL